MIKPNELRIGNLLHYMTAEVDITTCTIDWRTIQWATEDNEGFNSVHKPIPITDEWLMKLGFKSVYKSKTFSVYELGKFVIYLGGKPQTIFNEEDRGGINITYYRVKKGYEPLNEFIGIDLYGHVHQLQNMYFALTGEELTVKTS